MRTSYSSDCIALHRSFSFQLFHNLSNHCIVTRLYLFLTLHPNFWSTYHVFLFLYLSLYLLHTLFCSETLDPELIAAASAAASTLPNRSQAVSELLKQLRQHEAVTEVQKKGSMPNLGYVSDI